MKSSEATREISQELHKTLDSITIPGNEIVSINLSNYEMEDVEVQALQRALMNSECKVSTVDLSYKDIGNTGASSIAEAVRVNKSLTHLYLTSNNIWPDGALSIAEALLHNKTLSFLGLSHNRMGNAGVSRIAKAVMNHQSITHLDFSINQVDSFGVLSIAELLQHNRTLTSLQFSYNRIGPNGASSIANSLRRNETLTLITLDSCQIGSSGTSSIAEALKINRGLAYLDLSYNDIKDDGASEIAEAIMVNSSLAHLDISHNYIGEQGISKIGEAFKVNKNIASLNISHNYMGASGAFSIARAIMVNSSLTHLDISYDGIQDDEASMIMDAVEVNSSLTHLDLSHNFIGDEGVSSLTNALQYNKTLFSLNLGSNRIADPGALSIAEILQHNNLAILNLSCNQISNSGASSIAKALEHNQSLVVLDFGYLRSTVEETVIVSLLKNGSLLRVTGDYSASGGIGSLEEDEKLKSHLSANLAKAVASSKKGDADASWRLSVYFSKSDGSQSLSYLKSAAEGGHIFALRVIIELYKTGFAHMAGNCFSSDRDLRTSLRYEKILHTQLKKGPVDEHEKDFAFLMSTFFIQGENTLEQIHKAKQEQEHIDADENKKELYGEFQRQFNSILRAIQQANITNANPKTFTGTNRKDQLLKYSALLADTSAVTYLGLAVFESLNSIYGDAKFKKKCSKISNLIGNGENDIKLLSEALARKIVLDDELLQSVKKLITEEAQVKAGQKGFFKASQARMRTPKMSGRMSSNNLSLVSDEILKISTLLLDSIFNSEELNKKQTVNLGLVESLHNKLRSRLDLGPITQSSHQSRLSQRLDQSRVSSFGNSTTGPADADQAEEWEQARASSPSKTVAGNKKHYPSKSPKPERAERQSRKKEGRCEIM